MTTIKKLSIQGCRSYSDAQPEVIEFFKPLTIIVGANGSGKTTIIECLKFVTTGSMPPNSLGGKAFVHDPKAVGNAVVKAQIKLGFCTVDERPVLAIRSFQLAQRKNKREFKQIETVLRTLNDEGQQVSISHRCADMEKQVPQLMGVSKAVLENVIFCHQESSLWPLDDAKNLKTKFDDIFSATRYTKALELIRKLKADKTKEARFLDKDLEVVQVIMEEAHRLEDDLDHTERRIQEKKDNLLKIENEMRDYEDKLGSLGEKADEIRKIQARVKELEQEKEFMMSEKEKAHERMDNEFEDTDDELMQLWNRFKTEMDEVKRSVKEKEDTLYKRERKQHKVNEQYQHLVKALGKMQAQAEDYEHKKAELGKMALSMSETFSISGNFDFRQPKFHEKFLSKLMEVLQSKQLRLTQHKQEAQAADSDFERTLQSLRKKEHSLTEGKQRHQHDARRAEQRRNELAEGLKRIQARMGDMSTISERIAAAEQELSRCRREDRSDTFKNKIDSKTRQIKSNMQRMGQLSTERKALSAQQEQVTQLKFKRNELHTARKRHNSALDKLQSNMRSNRVAVSVNLPTPLPEDDELATSELQSSQSVYRSDTIERELRRQLASTLSKSDRARKDFDKANAEQAKLDSQLRAMQVQLNEAEASVAKQREQFDQAGVLKAVDDKNLDEEAKYAEKKLEKFRKTKQTNDAATVMYDRFLALAKEKKCCPLCTRGLEGAQLDKFVALNEGKMNRVRSGTVLAETEAKIQKFEAKLFTLKSLAGTWHEYKRITTEEMPSLKERVKAVAAKQEQITQAVTSCSGEVRALRSKEEALRELVKAASELSRLFREVVERLGSLRAAADKLRGESAGSRTLDDVQKEYDELENNNVDLTKALSSLQEEVELSRGKRDRQQQKVTELKEKKMELTRLELQRERTTQEAREQQATLARLKVDLEKGETLLAPLKQQIREGYEERKKLRLKNEELDRQLQKQAGEVQRRADQFCSLQSAIQKYEQSAQERKQMERSLEESKKEVEGNNKYVRDLQKDLEVSRQKIAEAEPVDQSIRANLDFRTRCKALLAQKRKIEELKKELREYTQDEDLLADMSDFKEDLEKLSGAAAELRGALKTEEHQAQKYRNQLESEKYDKIDGRHQDKLVEAKTTHMAAGDLDIYWKVLDRALIRYHATKMKEINSILKEYWRSTYRGKDIDEIYISANPTETSGTKRAYNYRVVMKQGDTELDMRGRCSAGQKVLACLLIRLALAETFCLQCGVLALDEPTTNLDEANITAFAQALSNIIHKRKDQKNFQLILITHDDDFVEKIGKRALTDYYYRVYKDINQHSKIRKQHL